MDYRQTKTLISYSVFLMQLVAQTLSQLGDLSWFCLSGLLSLALDVDKGQTVQNQEG